MFVMGTISQTEEPELFRHAKFQMQIQRWPEARSILQQLTVAAPKDQSYRALLAYVRGHEAAIAGDLERARAEWQRALSIDPKLEDAAQALRTRARRKSFVDRLFGR